MFLNGMAVRHASADVRAVEQPLQSMPELKPVLEGVLHAVCLVTLHARVVLHKDTLPLLMTALLKRCIAVPCPGSDADRLTGSQAGLISPGRELH